MSTYRFSKRIRLQNPEEYSDTSSAGGSSGAEGGSPTRREDPTIAAEKGRGQALVTRQPDGKVTRPVTSSTVERDESVISEPGVGRVSEQMRSVITPGAPPSGSAGSAGILSSGSAGSTGAPPSGSDGFNDATSSGSAGPAGPHSSGSAGSAGSHSFRSDGSAGPHSSGSAGVPTSSAASGSSPGTSGGSSSTVGDGIRKPRTKTTFKLELSPFSWPPFHLEYTRHVRWLRDDEEWEEGW